MIIFIIPQLVGQNICPFSGRKHYRGADRFEYEPHLRRQNSLLALFCRFMRIPRFVKHSDPIVKYDDGEDRNLFDFSEPKNTELGQMPLN